MMQDTEKKNYSKGMCTMQLHNIMSAKAEWDAIAKETPVARTIT